MQKNTKKEKTNKSFKKNGPVKQKWVPKAQVPEDKKKARDLQVLTGGKGTDTRTPDPTPESVTEALVVATQAKVLKVGAIVKDKTIRNLSLGIVLRALRGGLAGAVRGAETNPYFMYRYLTDTFTQAMQGTLPTIQQAPVWFWEICHALRPKETNFKTSRVNYSWEISPAGVDDSSPIPMQQGPSAYSVCLTADVVPGDFLGFPLLAPVPAATYNVGVGEKAIANLWSYVSGSPEMCKLIGDPGEGARSYGDTSAFSVVYPELGASYWTPGALRNTIYSERVISSPIFAKFAEYQEPGTTAWRGWQKASAGAGSACYIGPRLSEMRSMNEVHNKAIPVFKMYNFDEFYEVLSLTLGQAMCQTLHNAGTPIQVCPLNPIEVQILLRQTMIPLFGNDMAQDIYTAGNNTDDMAPFVVGQNGCASAVPMLLPTSLVENIRCSKRSRHTLRGGKGNLVIDYVSILGRPIGKPQLSNYTVDDVTPYVYKPLVDPINFNLIDCSVVSGNTTSYVDLSRQQILSLSAGWNKWIQTLSTNLSPLVTIGQEEGISILKTHMYTTFQSPIALPPPTPTPANNAQMVKQVSKKVLSVPGYTRAKLGVGPEPNTGYFAGLQDESTTSTLAFLAPTWKLMSNWILPVTICLPNQGNEQSSQGWKAFYVEPYEVTRSNSGGLGGTTALYSSTSAYDRHVVMASYDVKGIATDGQNEVISFLVDSAKKGRGGLLETIAQVAGPVLGFLGL